MVEAVEVVHGSEQQAVLGSGSHRLRFQDANKCHKEVMQVEFVGMVRQRTENPDEAEGSATNDSLILVPGPSDVRGKDRETAGLVPVVQEVAPFPVPIVVVVAGAVDIVASGAVVAALENVPHGAVVDHYLPRHHHLQTHFLPLLRRLPLPHPRILRYYLQSLLGDVQRRLSRGLRGFQVSLP